MFYKYKNLIIAIIVIVLAFLTYNFFFKSDSSSRNTSLSVTSAQNVDVLGRDITRVLNRIDKITLDTSIFTNPAFRSLIDHSRPITEPPVGRSNPFAPYSSFVTVSGTSGAGAQSASGTVSGN